LWNTSLLAFTNKLPMRALRDQLKYDALYPAPHKITTLANNHDTVRFMSLEGATLEGAMMHTAFTLSVRGIPQLYYGEEIAMEGKEDPENRHDFPGGFASGSVRDSRSALQSTGRTAKEQQMYEWTRSWIRLRAEHSSIRHGRLIDLFYDDDAYVFARQDQTETVIVAINRHSQEKNVTLTASSLGLKDGARLTFLMGKGVDARVVNGQATLILPARTAVAYRIL
ncbi:MAG: alpha-amylase family glycosyl hydrolase, partial [Pyrinomonadaceae bacterium]